MDVRHTMGVLHSFLSKIFFMIKYFRLFYFHVAILAPKLEYFASQNNSF